MEDLGDETDFHYKGCGYSFSLGLSLIVGLWENRMAFLAAPG
jgi:hypothetical protein